MTHHKVLVPDRLLRRFPGLSPISVSVNVGHPLFAGAPIPLRQGSDTQALRSSNY
jgi:hypothetical protein